MKRRQWIELHEQTWCPAAIRNAVTDFFRFIASAGDPYRDVVPRLAWALERSGAARIIDLCSGSGGPWLNLTRSLARNGQSLPVVLTDRHPNEYAFRFVHAASGGKLEYVLEPVDATCVPERFRGFRTIFGAFHHFEPDRARALLQNAVDQKQGIGIFEPVSRSGAHLFAIFFTSLMTLLVLPWIRPFRFSRLFWTYCVPIIPCVILFDGVVSCLRSYSTSELRALVNTLKGVNYDWEIGKVRIPRSPVSATYLIGVPRPAVTEV